MKIGVVIIHGIGRQDKHYADAFISKLKASFQKQSNSDRLIFEAVCWQEEIEPLENKIFQDMEGLGWQKLRSLFVGYAGDALAYQPSPVTTQGFYERIHQDLDNSLVKLKSQLPPDSPICIISHSLGTVVASNFIWDCQNHSSIGRSYYMPSKDSIEMVSNLKLLYTMGSPLATWSLRFPDGGLPIKCPRWFNMYNRNDIIGSPLKTINQHYKEMENLEDIQINVGSLLSKWNPASHVAYWEDNRVINHVAKNLISIK